VIVIRLQVGPLASNAYLLKDEASGAGAVVDPGAEGDRIVERCREEGLEPRLIINTHAHADHIGANAALKEAFPDALICIGAEDADRLADAAANLSALVPEPVQSPPADLLLRDGQQVHFGSAVLEVMETPGHTPGSICLLARQPEPPQIFSGDLIFQGSVGRTDLPGGSTEQLFGSIREKLLPLDDETIIWPGHGERTTLGAERKGNPFLQAGSLAHF